MNSNKDKGGWALLQAWKDASADLLIEYSWAGSDAESRFRGRIVSIEPTRLITFSSEGKEDVAVDMREARFERVGSKAIFAAVGLDPSKYDELVEIRSTSLDRLVIVAI